MLRTLKSPLDMLRLFGDASGLKTNMQKSSALPIQCKKKERETIKAHLPCQMLDFPCKYILECPYPSINFPMQVQPIIDKIADQLLGWKADLLTKEGRIILVRFVLTSMLLYLTMAMDLPAWALKAIDKIRTGFLWRGRKEVTGGHCAVAWPKVTYSAT